MMEITQHDQGLNSPCLPLLMVGWGLSQGTCRYSEQFSALNATVSSINSLRSAKYSLYTRRLGPRGASKHTFPERESYVPPAIPATAQRCLWEHGILRLFVSLLSPPVLLSYSILGSELGNSQCMIANLWRTRQIFSSYQFCTFKQTSRGYSIYNRFLRISGRQLASQELVISKQTVQNHYSGEEY